MSFKSSQSRDKVLLNVEFLSYLELINNADIFYKHIFRIKNNGVNVNNFQVQTNCYILVNDWQNDIEGHVMTIWKSLVFHICTSVETVIVILRIIIIIIITTTIAVLDPFAKLRKATFSFVMSVSLLVCMEQLRSHRTDFQEIWYLNIFRKSVGKNSSLFKIWQGERVLHMKTYFQFWSYSARMKNVSDKTCRGNQNTHCTFKNVFSNIVLLWDNVES
jgi:hypothetical protein